ncbi:MAG TPA: hypothetical protein V6C97_26570 [Oculatellaceae cyanobacterium]|jgi:Spy/CpxP family protein refolding chaperone
MMKNDSGGRKASLFFGPGTVFAILVAFLMMWSQYKPHKVQIERQIVPSSSGPRIQSPAAEQLLNWSSELSLTTDQRSKLELVLQKQRQALAPVNAEIDREMKDFDKFCTQHPSFQDIETHRKPLSELSQRKRLAEETFKRQSMELLDSEQQSTALRLYKASDDRFRLKSR